MYRPPSDTCIKYMMKWFLYYCFSVIYFLFFCKTYSMYDMNVIALLLLLLLFLL